MKCGRCLQDNPAGAKFCQHCGAPLSLACAACGSQLSPSARFCLECGRATGWHPSSADHEARSPGSYPPSRLGQKILMSQAAREGERKQVTVLFADLKSSMELLADRDPEEATRILDPVVELMIEAVHHYEGTVNQVMGDGIMALFGAPLAYEDHAVRACFAALRMQEHVRRHAAAIRDSHGVSIRIRVGLNSGEVVVRSVGNDLRMDYAAVGQTTHLAGRMEQMAEPGSILATADTMRLVEGYVQATSHGRVAVRGLEAAVEVYTITGSGAARSSLAAAVSRGLSRFVGREAELARLDTARQSAAEGRGQVVGLVGEPGVGKSRLVHEFTRPERMREWLVLKVAAVSYGKTTAYGPVIDLLRSYFGVEHRDEPRNVRAKVTARLSALEPNLAPMAPALLSLLDVPVEDPHWIALDPRQRRQQTLDALRRLVLRESEAQPLCLVLEDLHWIDFQTQECLDGLVESLPGARILLLVNYRPEYRHAWEGKGAYVEVRIDPLAPRGAEELLRALLGDDASLAPLERLLVERTEGSPFFLEESVRALVESGVLLGQRGDYRLARPVETVRVPPTVQAVLAARIDRLAPEDKRLLQCAAVIGETVPIELLRAAADAGEDEVRAGLARLRSADFLYDISPFPESEYAFRHGLTCRVTYDSLLQDRRRTLHKRIVEAIERLHPERLGEHVERLAYHACRGELWARAANYLRQAGVKAFERSANREAVVWFEQALQVVERLPDDPATQAEAVDLHLGLRNALTLLGEHERTLGHLHRAQALAARVGDRGRLGRALSFEVNCLFLLGQHERAIECASQARVEAAALDDVRLRAVTDMYAGRAHLSLGDYARAVEIFGGIVDTLVGPLAHDRLGVPIFPSVFARSHLVESLAALGQFKESARYAHEAIALAESTGHPDTMLWAYHGAGVHHLALGEMDRATEALERAYSLSRAHDMPAYRPRISAQLAFARALGGRAAEAVPIVERAAATATARRQTATYSHILLLQAEVYLLADRLPEATETTRRALDLFRRQRERGHEARALWLSAELAAREEPSAAHDAQTAYAEASALSDALGMRPLLARCELGRARLLARAGRSDRARAAFEIATTWLRELGMRADLARAEAELGAVR
jgi:class 3 adenylate cyclase/tetratricopeptide (TPR) repeat protein